MNRNKRFMAGAAALVVAAVGVAGLQGLANAYGPTSTSLPGALFIGNTVAGTTANTTNTFTDTLTLTQTPTNANAGDTVVVALSGVTGPSTGPVPVNTNTAVVRATISLTGAQTAAVALASYNNSTTGAAGTPACNYPASNIGTSSPEGPWATYGQFTASGNGSAALALNQIFFDDQGNGAGAPTADVCLGTANNADYYVSAVTQTAGSGQPGIAKTAPVDSTVVKNTFTITGPNAAVFAIGGAQAGNTGLSTRTGGGNVLAPKTATTVGTVNLRGTVWGLNKVSSDFTVELCNLSGASCNTTVSTNGKVVSTDGSGNLTARIGIQASASNGARAIKIQEGSNTSLTPIVVATAGTLAISPAAGGPGTVVSAVAGDGLPNERALVSAYINNTPLGANFYARPDGTQDGACISQGAPATPTFGGGTCVASGPFIRGSVNQYVSPLSTFSSGGTFTTSVTVADPNTVGVQWSAKKALCTGVTTDYDYTTSASPFTCAPQDTNVDLNNLVGANAAKGASFTISLDQCVAYTGDLTGGAGCATKQNVNVSVLQGNLTQRVYVNSAAATGTGVASSSASTPVVGTSNVNTDATTVNLGTLTTPLAPVVITGTLNDITVSDNRGGVNGWSLTATGSSFAGVPSGTIAASALTATPSCAAATTSTAWDYSAVGKTAISGFDASLNAGGITAGSAAQAFGSTVNLCTKSTAVNATTGSTGGVFNVTSSLSLTVPAFQKAARYTALVTITLA